MDQQINAELAEIAKRRINDEAGTSLSRPFVLGDDGTLCEICDAAGIPSVTITAHDGRARFPSIEEFARTEIKAWLLADSVDEARLSAVIADAQDAFAGYCAGEGAADCLSMD